MDRLDAWAAFNEPQKLPRRLQRPEQWRSEHGTPLVPAQREPHEAVPPRLLCVWATELGESYSVEAKTQRGLDGLWKRNEDVIDRLNASYGCTKADCDGARKIADAMLTAVQVAVCDISEEP